MAITIPWLQPFTRPNKSDRASAEMLGTCSGNWSMTVEMHMQVCLVNHARDNRLKCNAE